MAQWFAAHIVLVQRFIDDAPQEEFGVYENICLVTASTVEEAWTKAEAIGQGRETTGSSGDEKWCGRRTKWSFAGVRKVIRCGTISTRTDGPPGDGEEVSYSQLTLSSEDDLIRLVKGESVTVRYDE